ncbi:MAG: CapA family protein [Pseudomonadota bacterium]
MQWEFLFLFPRWRLPAAFPRAPIKKSSDDDDEYRLCFAGDLMVKSGDAPVIVDPALRQEFAAAEMLFTTLESPVVPREKDEAVRYPKFLRMPPFEMPIAFLEEQAKQIGLPPERICLSVAANHAGDLGPEAFAAGCSILENSGFRVVGRQNAGAAPVDLIVIGDVRIALAAWTRWMNAEPFLRAQPGVNRQFEIEASNWTSILADAPHDIAIAMPHWGLEMRATPDAPNRLLAHHLAEIGFDLVVGSHPHMLQPLEAMNGGLCAYSLGNFTYTLSNIAKYCQSWRSCLSGVLRVGVNRRTKKISSYELIPIVEYATPDACYICRLHDYLGSHRDAYVAMIENLFSSTLESAA